GLRLGRIGRGDELLERGRAGEHTVCARIHGLVRLRRVRAHARGQQRQERESYRYIAIYRHDQRFFGSPTTNLPFSLWPLSSQLWLWPLHSGSPTACTVKRASLPSPLESKL